MTFTGTAWKHWGSFPLRIGTETPVVVAKARPCRAVPATDDRRPTTDEAMRLAG